MNIAIGADHGGFHLKQFVVRLLTAEGHSIQDMGTYSPESVDYPDYADQVCAAVVEARAERGILICGTGIGMSMVANRHRRIRAAVCHDEYTARLSREHNKANVLCLGDRVLGTGVAEGIVKVWLAADFDGGRHQRRIAKFSD